MTNGNAGLFSARNVLIAFTVSSVYLLLSFFLIGYKTDQLILTAIFNGCFFASLISRKFITGFAIFIVYWILFDYMKAFPNYRFSAVHIKDLYDTEKAVFGIHQAAGIITPNEYWLLNGRSWLDIMSGIFYLCWIPVPLAFAAYLFFNDKEQFLHFSLSFVLVNLLGFIIYYTYPAAPPWYYQLHGATFLPGTPGNTAGLHKFDDYFGIDLFRSIYEKGSNVFAAMPSLHSAYPLIVVYYAFKKKLGWINLLFVTVTVGIWFAAVYTSHHYVLDVIMGIACAITGLVIFQRLLLHSRVFKNFLFLYKLHI